MANRCGNSIRPFWRASKSLQMAIQLKDTPWKKSYDQSRQHIQKQRHYFANEGPSSQGYDFSSSHVWMEIWTIKKAEHRRIDAFELWFWKRLLRVTWTARRSSQSILKESSPEYPLEGLMLKLKLQYFGHLIQRADSLEKTLMLGKIEGGGEGDDRGWDGWMASPTQWTWIWVNSRELVMDREAWCASVHGVAELDMTEQLNWVFKKKGTQQHFPCFKWAQWSFESNIWRVEPWRNWYF